MATFSRLLDLENFCTVLELLDGDELDAVEGRVGMMHYLNPIWPDRGYQLDLRAADERGVAEQLVKLAVKEPGLSWNNAQFKDEAKDEDYMRCGRARAAPLRPRLTAPACAAHTGGRCRRRG